MLVVLIGLAGLVVLVVAFVVWRIFATMAAGQRLHSQLLARLATVTDALAAGTEPSAADLAKYAGDRQTRRVLYETLAEAGRLGLFPKECLSWEAIAEADLVFWLMHPNELAAAPDEIEQMARVPAPGTPAGQGGDYFVFRFRTHPPHWAAGSGWTAGIAGPFLTNGDFVAHGEGTFSRFEAYSSRTPEEHVRVTHEGVMGKSPAATSTR